MRSRGHMVTVLAAAAAALSGIGSLGAQAELLPVPRIQSLPAGGGSGKRGKHRQSGTSAARGNWLTDWSGRRTEGRKTLREQRNQQLGRNLDLVDYHARRMAWLARNQHVIEKRDADQARAKGNA